MSGAASEEGPTRHDRVAAFLRRVADDPEAARRTDVVGTFLVLDPLADEPELLVRLGRAPEDCLEVRCLWRWEGDVHRVVVRLGKSVEVVARRSEDPEEAALDLVAEVAGPATVTTTVVEQAIERLAKAPLPALTE